MTDEHLGPLVSGSAITAELRRRKSRDIHKTVTATSGKPVAEKVKAEEAEGWKTLRKNVKSTRMSKPKPADEQLEDELWCLLAQMGFHQLSSGRQFSMAVRAGLPRRWFGIFAKDDESAILVECARRDTPGREPMVKRIEDLRTCRDELLKTLRRAYGQQTRLKVKLVIATRNIQWTEADLGRCEEAQIAVLSDGEIDYYNALVQHLKHAARYQFLGHMFGGQKIDGLAKKVVATRGKMGGETFYTFLMRPDELLKIAYVGHKASRDIEKLATYQRMLQPHRLKKIAEYINEGGKFPTNIVVNIKTGKRSCLKFDRKEEFGEEELGILHLPANYASAWIIDGQHRLYGYAYARQDETFNQDKTVIPVLAYENLPADREKNLFIDINSKQVKVNKGLLGELYSDLHWESDNPEEAFQALLSRIAARLNSDKTSPLFDRMVVTGKKKSNYRCLTQTSISDGIDVAKLLGAFSRGAIVPGPISTDDPNAYAANLEKALSVLGGCLGMVAQELPTQWKIGDGQGGYVCTNNGVRALFHVIRDVSDHLLQKDGRDLCRMSADEALSEIAPYIQSLTDFMKSAKPQDIQAFRRIGSSLTAVRQQAHGMEAQIAKKFPDFAPAGMKEYLESRDEAGTEEAAAKVTKIHRRLFDHVIGALKKQYGTQGKAWWTKGIPLKIRQQCSLAWEEKDREGDEESHLYLISYIDICHQNWELVRDVISLDAKNKDNKKLNTKWIKELNDIRTITAHPERGVLSTDQVSFVNEMCEKVERYFPADDGQSKAVA